VNPIGAGMAAHREVLMVKKKPRSKAFRSFAEYAKAYDRTIPKPKPKESPWLPLRDPEEMRRE